jgi:hypothetical protein
LRGDPRHSGCPARVDEVGQRVQHGHVGRLPLRAAPSARSRLPVSAKLVRGRLGGRLHRENSTTDRAPHAIVWYHAAYKVLPCGQTNGSARGHGTERPAPHQRPRTASGPGPGSGCRSH